MLMLFSHHANEGDTTTVWRGTWLDIVIMGDVMWQRGYEGGERKGKQGGN